MRYTIKKEKKESLVRFHLLAYGEQILRKVSNDGTVVVKDMTEGIKYDSINKVFDTPAGKCDISLFMRRENNLVIFNFSAYPMIKFQILKSNANDLQAYIYITKDFALQLHSFSGGNSMEYAIVQLQQKRTQPLRRDEAIVDNKITRTPLRGTLYRLGIGMR